MIITQWETPFKQWLNDQLARPKLGSAGSVMSGFPLGKPVFPVIVCSRLGGGPEWPVDVPRVRIRVWGNTKDEAEELITKIANVIEDADGRPTPMGTVEMRATSLDSFMWAPDEVLSNQPSYIVDATLVFINREGE